MRARVRLEGCLLGCAVGDSLGLPYEGLSPRRIAKNVRPPLQQRFIFGNGMVSDDTDHSIFVAQALARYPEDLERFRRCLATRFRFWLLCLPAGIGLATLRSTLKLWIGCPPSRSGVFSAGNGAAMRSAIIGIFHESTPESRKRFVSASTKLTHSDPKADFGAQAVAALAAHAVSHESKPSLQVLRSIITEAGDGAEWDDVVERTVSACESGSLADAVAAADVHRGVSGYVYHTVPVAIAAWYIHHGDFRNTIESVVMLGGDTDTVAAIAGSLAGANVGSEGIPLEWVTNLIDRPHGSEYISKLAFSLSNGQKTHTSFSWYLFPRGLLFTAIVLYHGFRRLLPPY